MIFVFKNVFWILFLFDTIDALSYHCPSLILPHGKIRYLSRGRKARFICYRPYTLVGDSNIIDCINGEWDASIPFCAKKDCPKFPKVLHGRTSYPYDGAVAKTNCDEGFSLIGSSYMYCSTTGWNDTADPECLADSITQFDMCHFEPDETKQCNWVSKPSFFNWTVLSSDLHESVYLTTDIYPKHDHTLTPHQGGHFLYLETLITPSVASQQIMKTRNAAAKYISPLFPAIDEKSENHCLIFYYYSNGPHAGNVQVLIDEDLIWANNRSLGDEWHKIKIMLQYQPSPFRIIIEGTGQLGSITNTAIDDLKIAQGQECNDDITLRTMEFSTKAETETTTVSMIESHTSAMTTYSETEQKQLETEQPRTNVSSPPNDLSSPLDTSFETQKTSTVDNVLNTKNAATTFISTPNTNFSNAFNQHGITESPSTMEILITESNFVYHAQTSANNSDSKGLIIIEKEPSSINSTSNVKRDEYVKTNIFLINSTSDAAIAAVEEKLNLHQSISGEDSAHSSSHKNSVEENHDSNKSTTYLTFDISNDTVVKSNNSIYEYSHQEENDQNQAKQERNYGHFESVKNNLENKQTYKDEFKSNQYSYDNKQPKEAFLEAKHAQSPQSDDHFVWIFLFTVASAGICLLLFIMMFVAILKKYRKFSDKNKDESSIRFFNNNGIEGTILRRNEQLVMNCVPHNV